MEKSERDIAALKQAVVEANRAAATERSALLAELEGVRALLTRPPLSVHVGNTVFTIHGDETTSTGARVCVYG